MDENGTSSQCLVHAGDPCIDNSYCNNTCSETEKNCYRTENITCGSESSCNVTECSQGECRVLPTNEDEKCGNGTACSKDLCLAGVCSSVPLADDTLCGQSLECSVDLCIDGKCVTRTPEPEPLCSICPCESGKACDEASEQCKPVDQSNDDRGIDMHMIFYLGIALGSGALFTITGMFLYRRYRKKPSLQYALLEVDEEKPTETIVFNAFPTTAAEQDNASSGGGGGALVTAQEVRKSSRFAGNSKSTVYVREDEDVGHRRINKKT